MDLLQDYLPQAAYLYNTYYAPYSSYLLPIQRTIRLSQVYFYRYFFPYLWPAYKLFSRATAAIFTENPSIYTLALLALVLVVSIKILDMIRQTIIYWISLAIKLLMWAVIVGAGLYVYYRGVEETVEDAGWVIGVLAGLEKDGERVGSRKARGRQWDARAYGKKTPRGRTRGAGW